MNCELWIMYYDIYGWCINYKWWILIYELCITNKEWWILIYELWIMSYGL